MPGTIGYTTIGSGAVTMLDWYTVDAHHPSISALTYTAGSNEAITSVSVYGSSSNNGIIPVAIYECSGSTIGNRLGSPVIVQLGSTPGWYSAPCRIPLTNGVTYTTAFDMWSDPTACVVYRNTGLSGTRRSNSALADLPTTWSQSGTTPDESFSFYATVEAVEPTSAWSGAITLKADIENHATSTQSLTTESFTPAANSLLFVYHCHSADGTHTVPNKQITNTGGLTFARYSSVIMEFFATADVQVTIFVAEVGASPSSMTLTVDPYTTTDNAHQGLAVFDVTNAVIVQSPVSNLVNSSSESHTTAALPKAPTSGNLVIAGFSAHTNGATPAIAPSGFSTIVSQDTGGYQVIQGIFSSTTHTGTTVTCTDIGQPSIWMTASMLMEIASPVFDEEFGGVFIGNTEITNAYLGTTVLSKIYVGNDEIWSA